MDVGEGCKALPGEERTALLPSGAVDIGVSSNRP